MTVLTASRLTVSNRHTSTCLVNCISVFCLSATFCSSSASRQLVDVHCWLHGPKNRIRYYAYFNVHLFLSKCIPLIFSEVLLKQKSLKKEFMSYWKFYHNRHPISFKTQFTQIFKQLFHTYNIIHIIKYSWPCLPCSKGLKSIKKVARIWGTDINNIKNAFSFFICITDAVRCRWYFRHVN